MATGLDACKEGRRRSYVNVEDEVHVSAMHHGVQVSKFSRFAVRELSTEDMYFRMTFAAVPYVAMSLATERFGNALEDVSHI